MNSQVNNNNKESFANAETQMTASIPVPNPATVDFSANGAALNNVFALLNHMLDMKMAVIIIRKQKVQYSIVRFKDYNAEWMLCEVENVSGTGSGDDLVLLVQKTTPITLYATGAVKSPFN